MKNNDVNDQNLEQLQKTNLQALDCFCPCAASKNFKKLDI
jgi:hypothetical protein